MKRAMGYISKLSFENMTLEGIAKISHDMDDFNDKEKFEVLLALYAHSLFAMPLVETKKIDEKEEKSITHYKRRFFGGQP